MDGNEKYVRRGGPGRLGAGLFLLLIGGVLLLDQMGFPLPSILFNWHVLLIAGGIFIGLRHHFRGGGWFIMIAVGLFFFIQDYFPEWPIRRFLWPGVIILIGLCFIFQPRRSSRWWRGDWNANAPNDPNTGGPDRPFGTGRRCGNFTTGFASSKEGYSSEDFIDSTTIFGGVHKKIVSKNFRGGDVTTVMGGTELDFTQADFTGIARLDVTQLMGGTKIIVPAHWEVRSEVTAVFAGYEDKRQQPAVTNPDKLLILSGSSVFGGIELKNY